MAKRVIYSIDEKVFDFVKNKLEKSFEMNNDGYTAKYEGGLLHIFRHCVISDKEKVRVFFKTVDAEGYSKIESTYEFSSEYSEKIREIIFKQEDEKYLGWKEEHENILSHISSIEKIEEEKQTANLIAEFESKIKQAIEENIPEVLIYTTKGDDYVLLSSDAQGFGVNDLKNPYFNAYNTLLTKYGKKFLVRLNNPTKLAVDFIYVKS
jgi:hypothetical protein